MRMVNEGGRTAMLCLLFGTASETTGRLDDDVDGRRARGPATSSLRFVGFQSARL
jgi:hypothetical protein